MVFKHDDRPTLDNFYYFPYRHSREVHSRVQRDSGAGCEGGETVDKYRDHGGEKPVIHSMEEYFESNGIIAIPTNQSSAHADIHSLARTTSDRSDGSDRSVGKHVRYSEEELCMVACKRARHEVFGNEPLSNDPCPLEDAMNILPAAVHGESGENVDAMGEGKPCSTPVEVLGAGNRNHEAEEYDNSENQTKNSCNCCDSEDEVAEWELPRQSPLPRFFGRNHLSSDEAFSEDLPLSFCDRFPRKHVALGPDHQVDIPSWCSWNSTDSDEDNSKRLMGTPVLSMPDSGNKATPEIVGVGGDANYCECIDKGSIGCTRRHVAEARERTRQKLGLEKFVGLGFHDMGEDVALGWSEEEELLFEKIVFSNPASMGMNFWNVLPQFFPSRSTKDLVSYYFNVFMLRKRASQNRFDPWNVDSDNDEWQESDDGDFTMEDSGQGVYYQSPVDQEEVTYVEEEEAEEEEEEDEDEDDLQEADEEGFEEPDVTDETTAHGQPDFSLKPRPAFVEPLQKHPQESVEEHDAQDESCTSFEGQHGVDSGADPFTTMASPSIMTNAPRKNVHEECRSNSRSMRVPGSCDHKEWDVGYFTSGKVDFLPTCYVIEEVFGKDSRDEESMDCRGTV